MEDMEFVTYKSNKIWNSLVQVVPCSAQTVKQNTNVAAEVCKVVIERASDLTVKP